MSEVSNGRTSIQEERSSPNPNAVGTGPWESGWNSTRSKDRNERISLVFSDLVVERLPTGYTPFVARADEPSAYGSSEMAHTAGSALGRPGRKRPHNARP